MNKNNRKSFDELNDVYDGSRIFKNFLTMISGHT